MTDACKHVALVADVDPAAVGARADVPGARNIALWRAVQSVCCHHESLDCCSSSRSSVDGCNSHHISRS
jgi:hypothetical protein